MHSRLILFYRLNLKSEWFVLDTAVVETQDSIKVHALNLSFIECAKRYAQNIKDARGQFFIADVGMTPAYTNHPIGSYSYYWRCDVKALLPEKWRQIRRNGKLVYIRHNLGQLQLKAV
jgi:hypothetical protein